MVPDAGFTKEKGVVRSPTAYLDFRDDPPNSLCLSGSQLLALSIARGINQSSLSILKRKPDGVSIRDVGEVFFHMGAPS